jgi:hypothetical protein
MYKCVICHEFVGDENKENKRRAKTSYKIIPSTNVNGISKYSFVICGKCLEKYQWSPQGRFFRYREPNKDWHSQYNLFKNICELGYKYGYDKRCVYTEVGFPDWALNSKGNPLRFDIAIPSKKVVIEYNGQQHYNHKSIYHHSRDDYDIQKNNDRDKKDCVKAHGWYFILFTYMEDTNNIEWVNMRIKKVFEVLNGNKSSKR